MEQHNSGHHLLLLYGKSLFIGPIWVIKLRAVAWVGHMQDRIGRGSCLVLSGRPTEHNYAGASDSVCLETKNKLHLCSPRSPATPRLLRNNLKHERSLLERRPDTFSESLKGGGGTGGTAELILNRSFTSPQSSPPSSTSQQDETPLIAHTQHRQISILLPGWNLIPSAFFVGMGWKNLDLRHFTKDERALFR